MKKVKDLTIREHIAIEAMKSLLIKNGFTNGYHEMIPEFAVKYADGLIKKFNDPVKP